MKTAVGDKLLLADAVAELVENLHQKYPGIKTKPIPPIEDEDFSIQVMVPAPYSTDEVENSSHAECIKMEDKYGVYILPVIVK